MGRCLKVFGILTVLLAGLSMNLLQASQLYSMHHLSRPESPSVVEWHFLRNAINDAILNDKVYLLKQDIQERLASGRACEQIRVNSKNENYAASFPHLAEGFDILRASGQDIPTFEQFIPLQLNKSLVLQQLMQPGSFDKDGDDGSQWMQAFADSIHQAQYIIIHEMKEPFLQALKAPIKQKKFRWKLQRCIYEQYGRMGMKISYRKPIMGNEDIIDNQDPVFQYVLKYSIGIKGPDGSLMNTKEFMKPVVKQWVNEDDKEVHPSFLYEAIRFDLVDVAKLLIDAGADVDGNDEHTLPLHCSIGCSKDIIKLLIDAGADVDIATWWGLTALHLSVSYGHIDQVELLLNAGADIDIECDGKTAEDWAKEKVKTARLNVILHGNDHREAQYFAKMREIYFLLRDDRFAKKISNFAVLFDQVRKDRVAISSSSSSCSAEV